ncbi:hypothetical protein F5877DRAFT_69555 [Lentinula edodes]|nr:hypothetical protein F5877DRAFT_69555 [Lentinula edodes]
MYYQGNAFLLCVTGMVEMKIGSFLLLAHFRPPSDSIRPRNRIIRSEPCMCIEISTEFDCFNGHQFTERRARRIYLESLAHEATQCYCCLAMLSQLTMRYNALFCLTISSDFLPIDLRKAPRVRIKQPVIKLGDIVRAQTSNPSTISMAQMVGKCIMDPETDAASVVDIGEAIVVEKGERALVILSKLFHRVFDYILCTCADVNILQWLSEFNTFYESDVERRNTGRRRSEHGKTQDSHYNLKRHWTNKGKEAEDEKYNMHMDRSETPSYCCITAELKAGWKRVFVVIF